MLVDQLLFEPVSNDIAVKVSVQSNYTRWRRKFCAKLVVREIEWSRVFIPVDGTVAVRIIEDAMMDGFFMSW